MDWMEVSIHTGERMILDHDEMMRLSNARKIDQLQKINRGCNRPFHTDHYWYRPATEDDFRHERMRAARAEVAARLSWADRLAEPFKFA